MRYGRYIRRTAAYLSDHPGSEEVELLALRREDHLGGVEHAEVGRTVDDDALHGDEETAVETDRSVGLEDLHEAVAEALELARRALAHIRGETGTGEVERVDEAERGRTGRATGGKVSGEELPEVLLLVHTESPTLVLRQLLGVISTHWRGEPSTYFLRKRFL